MLRVCIKFTSGVNQEYKRVLEVWECEGKTHIRRYGKNMEQSSVLTLNTQDIEFQHISVDC